jgi:hypothetical protein
MLPTGKSSTRYLIIGFVLMISIVFLVACSSSSTDADDEATTEEMEHEESEHESEHDEEESEHDEEERIPNDGSSIRILDPTDGATFAEGDEVLIEVNVSDFALGEDGNHWHIYVDGTSGAMVVGGRTTEALRGLEPGERKIEVYLTGGDHVELEDGDSITIMVE